MSEQVERADDERSDRFINGSLDSWLTLRDLGDAPPDRNKFEAYYEEIWARAEGNRAVYVRHRQEPKPFPYGFQLHLCEAALAELTGSRT